MITAIVRPLIAFLVVAALLCGLEALWPERRQPRLRAGGINDLVYLVVDVGVRRIAGGVVVLVAIALLLAKVSRPSIASAQPLGLQAIEVIVGGDIIGYWLHRAFHTFRWLWPFHAVHHSSKVLDWVAAARQHPVDNAVHKVLVVLPFFLLGFSPGVVAGYAPFLTLYPIMLHANVSWGFGPLRWIIASPAFHRWHHAAEAAALDRNFAGLLPCLDLLFGTAYFPARPPREFGLYDADEPRGILRQLAYPFRQLAA